MSELKIAAYTVLTGVWSGSLRSEITALCTTNRFLIRNTTFTTASSGSSYMMAQFLSSWPPGRAYRASLLEEPEVSCSLRVSLVAMTCSSLS